MKLAKKTVRICIYGIVQGVGFRPFVSRLANECNVTGSVANKGSYVEVFARASEEDLAIFERRIEEEAPERSAILKVTVTQIGPEEADRAECRSGSVYSSFRIIESTHEEGNIFVSPDIAICDKCRAELFDRSDRRYMHPFINCTACGPRLTILEGMPYDRERTSMKIFKMCPECEAEYYSPESRRFDAQPVCCSSCGPEVYIVGTDVRGRDAITAARRAVKDGKIIAVKGIGGFHLCCDATCEEAVIRLRKLKNRPARPFAVMARNIEAVYKQCIMPPQGVSAAERLLCGHEKPIVLLEKRPDTALAPQVAPDNPKVGVMLPYAPVQLLLFDYDDGMDIGTDLLVMTSGNISGAPICRSDEDALSQISSFCDLILSHNRDILLRCDDSVADIYDGEPYMIRRSRGYAPLPVMAGNNLKGCVLGIGGDLKNTFCIAKDELFYESPYVGDMEDIRTLRALNESVLRMEELLEAKPLAAVCDLHPRYNSVSAAMSLGITIKKIQHHFAHILSCMAENDFTDPVIGLSFDGTGYGSDGTIWGGEILIADCFGFERFGSIRPFMQAGGDLAAKEGWRIAASMISSLYGGKKYGICEGLNICSAEETDLICSMAASGINTVTSTSAGRLFDAVSAVLGVRRISTFEGEASAALQFRAMEYLKKVPYDTALSEAEKIISERPELVRPVFRAASDPADIIISAKEALQDNKEKGGERPHTGAFVHLPTDELFRFITDRAVLSANEKGKTEASGPDHADVCRLSWIFHAVLAAEMAEAAEAVSEMTGIKTAALSGGVFQNTLLLRLAEEYIKKAGLKCIRHRLIPPNDGGIALGQAFYGMHWLKTV